jgi:hypothetical protein
VRENRLPGVLPRSPPDAWPGLPRRPWSEVIELAREQGASLSARVDELTGTFWFVSIRVHSWIPVGPSSCPFVSLVDPCRVESANTSADAHLGSAHGAGVTATTAVPSYVP